MTDIARATIPALYALSNLRSPWFSWLMGMVTWLGDGVFFVVVGVICYWCWNKRAGQFMLSVGLCGAAAAHFLKNIFRIPRPWLLDENFAIVESARARATGYSFPSGHTQMSIGLYGAMAIWTKHRAVRIVAIALMVLVPFSRMLLGVHTPLDIGVAAAISLILLIVLRPSFTGDDSKVSRTYAALTLISLVLLIATVIVGHPAEATEEELTNGWDGIKAICQSLAGIMALWLGHEVDRRYTHWETAAPLPAQVIKSAGGLAVIGALFALVHYIPKHIVPLRVLGYFVAIAAGTVLWPMTFKRISALCEKK